MEKNGAKKYKRDKIVAILSILNKATTPQNADDIAFKVRHMIMKGVIKRNIDTKEIYQFLHKLQDIGFIVSTPKDDFDIGYVLNNVEIKEEVLIWK